MSGASSKRGVGVESSCQSPQALPKANPVPTNSSAAAQNSLGPADADGPVVRVETLAYEGPGVARLSDGEQRGQVVFVNGAAPGDTVRLTDIDYRGRFARARVGHIVAPSPFRTPPRCDFFGVCGGCQWQHVQSDAQVAAKVEIVRDQLQRVGGFSKLPPLSEIEVIQGPEYGYRRTARLMVTPTAMGFRRALTHDPVDLEHPQFPSLTTHADGESSPTLGAVQPFGVPPSSTRPPTTDLLPCPVLHPALKPHIRALMTAARLAGIAHGEVQAFVLPSPIAGDLPAAPDRDMSPPWAARVWSREPFDIAPFRDLLAASSVPCGMELVAAGVVSRWGASVVVEPDEWRVPVPVFGFVQPNSFVNRGMRRVVSAMVDETGAERILELFCGSGNFTRPLARPHRRIVAVEGVPAAVAAAREWLTEVPGEVRFHARPVRPALRREISLGTPDLVLLDPPRTGSPEAMALIDGLQPNHVLYISCNPTTLARDLSELRSMNYHIGRLAVADAFPQTYHVETLIRLDRG